jgi:hypothetical protein
MTCTIAPAPAPKSNAATDLLNAAAPIRAAEHGRRGRDEPSAPRRPRDGFALHNTTEGLEIAEQPDGERRDERIHAGGMRRIHGSHSIPSAIGITPT